MAITATDTKPELTKYELAEQIGHGGMATVYRAVDRRLGRDVAVKLIHPHLRGNTEVAARFVGEARAVAKLKHPNIVEVYDISDEAEVERYLIVELIEGPTLRQLLGEHGRLPPEIAIAVALQLAAALRHAHDQNIVHRDVKPENVLIHLPRRQSSPGVRDEDDHVTVKLTDFGIAKLLDAHGVTSTGQVLGSPAHMAPEQIEGGGVGPRSDVFGLGVLLFESVVGSLPFDGSNPAQVLRRVLDGDHAPAVKLQPEVGARLSDILDKALSRSPDDRYESVEAFSRALEAELERVGIEDPQAELDAFIDDPAAYREAFSVRIVEALARAGEAARTAGRVGVASACFNRALAYRPGDAQLLSRVSAVSRGEALRKGGAVVAALVVLGVGAYGAWRVWPSESASQPTESKAVARPASRPTAEPSAQAVSAPPGAPSMAASVQPGPAPFAAGPRKPPTLVSGRTTRSRSPRKVQVIVQGGPQGGDVYIDGIRLENWFTRPVVELATGTRHVFEFKHSNEGCCVSTPVSRVLEPGDDLEPVTLHVAYRDATLKVSGGPGMIFCNTLFSGGLEVPGSREIPMRDPDTSGQCTFKPADTAGSPSAETASLRAGQATTITVP